MAAVEEGTVMKIEIKGERVKQWCRGELRDSFVFGLGQLFFALVLVGIVFYVAAQYKMEIFQSFELAMVAGVLGGFPLLAAFGGKVGNEGLRKKLRRVGGLYVFAAVLFVVFGFYQAVDQASLISQNGVGVEVFKVVYAVTFYGAAVPLILGMWLTLRIIPELVGLGDVRDNVKKIFKRRK